MFSSSKKVGNFHNARKEGDNVFLLIIDFKMDSLEFIFYFLGVETTTFSSKKVGNFHNVLKEGDNVFSSTIDFKMNFLFDLLYITRVA
jgi:hypothetical protein